MISCDECQRILSESDVPADAIKALARQLLPAIRSYYESGEGKAAFAEWKSVQEAKALSASSVKKKVG